MTTQLEYQIRILQGQHYEPEEPIVQPWPLWKLRAFWATAIIGCLIFLGGAGYCLWNAYQALAS